MLLKASRITTLTDARYFAAREVDFLGFNLEAGTEGYIDPVIMNAFREWVNGPAITGEFSDAPAGVVLEAASFFKLDAVQLSAERYLADLEMFDGLRVILDLDTEHSPESLEMLLTRALPYTELFLLHLDATGLPAGFDPHLFAHFPLMLELDLPVSDWPALLAQWKPKGLSLRGGEEEAVGIRSFDELDEAFELLQLRPE